MNDPNTPRTEAEAHAQVMKRNKEWKAPPKPECAALAVDGKKPHPKPNKPPCSETNSDDPKQ